MSELHDIVANATFAVSPLTIVLFAAEICAIEDMINGGRLSISSSGWKNGNYAILYVMLKNPLSLILPVATGLPGAVIVIALDIVSIVAIVRWYAGCGPAEGNSL